MKRGVAGIAHNVSGELQVLKMRQNGAREVGSKDPDRTIANLYKYTGSITWDDGFECLENLSAP